MASQVVSVFLRNLIGRHGSGAARCLFAASFLALALGTAARADIVGEARIIDGDTIEIAGERIRLHGIDAPETSQTCDAAGVPWRCGESATLALVDETDGRPVTCKGDRRDRYGRIIAVCYSGERDLNAMMVREGWALAYRRYAKDYVEAEIEARDARKGMWRADFVEPWKWRRGERQTAQR
jgi:endonuclease YncB( thermonuclease family)